MENRLKNERSPYLQQHAHNPVDWYPWSEEALQKARREGKPIFLSIGYSACHWCHVMAHESFEDERVAGILNEHFVSIKVDREERPDLDRIYMNAVQAMTGSGGWPMSVFLSPEGRPFYGGTYYPPVPRYGMPSFMQVLQAVVDAWQNRRQELLAGSARIVQAIEQQNALPGERQDGTPDAAGSNELDPAMMTQAFEQLQQSFDPTHGGWGDAPKFPQPMAIEFLMRYHNRTGDPQALRMTAATLDAMARGGMYDQIGGGFHRYSVDDHWLVPHFEKMLYDNALLARVYLHAWQVMRRPLYHAVVRETLDWVLREMSDASGGFYATLDADSEGEEGKFYLWTPDEIRAVLDAEAPTFARAYGVTQGGNFEGRNILTLVGPMEERPLLGEARRALLAAREQRMRPGRDEKILVSWNGLMLATLSEAARLFEDGRYRQAAEGNAAFLLDLRRRDGRLPHVWQGGASGGNGYLEDYTHLAHGLITLYQTTFDPRWYRAAYELIEYVLAHFDAGTGFYDTSDDHETLITRPREMQDNAVPSGNAMAASVLLRLSSLAVEPRYATRVQEMLMVTQPLLARYPLGFGQWLNAFERATATPYAVAVIGDPESADTQTMLAVYHDTPRPHHVIAAGRPRESAVPLLQHREQIRGRATAYVCIGTVCREPITDPAVLSALLGAS